MKKMKNIKRILCLLALVLTTALTYGQVAQDCGALDCPGRCGRFIDQNGDGFCDRGRLSKPVKVAEPEQTVTPTKVEETKAQTETAAETKTQTKTETHTQAKGTQNGGENTVVSDTRTAVSDAPEEAATYEDATPVEDVPEAPAKPKSPYHLILVTALTLGLYAISAILVKANVWKKATHRKVWNVLLLITGLVSCLLGFFLVIQINYNVRMDWFWTIKVYHVEFGIAMTLIMLIHILWHMNYWKSIFKAKKQ